MQVGKAIKSLLNTAGYDCYPDVIPKTNTGDAIVYHVISDVPLTAKRNTSLVDTFRVQINCYSHNYTGAVALASGVRAALDGKTGDYGTLTVDQITFITQQSDYDREMNEVGIIQEYFIKIKL